MRYDTKRFSLLSKNILSTDGHVEFSKSRTLPFNNGSVEKLEEKKLKSIFQFSDHSNCAPLFADRSIQGFYICNMNIKNMLYLRCLFRIKITLDSFIAQDTECSYFTISSLHTQQFPRRRPQNHYIVLRWIIHEVTTCWLPSCLY